jgi:hypothetical protein
MKFHCLVLLFLLLVNVLSYNWNSVTRHVNSFKDSKFFRQTISSSRKEKQESQAIKRRKQVKAKKSIIAANVNRHLSFRTANSSNYESIISLYLRRSSFVRKTRKVCKGINFDWFYYKDIVVRGKPVFEAISVIDNEMGGTVEETAQNYLQTTVCSYLSSSSSAMSAYKELLTFDPRIKASLSPENLEFGFEIKKKETKPTSIRPSKEQATKERTIFPFFLSSVLPSIEKKKKDLDFFIKSDKMDNFMLHNGGDSTKIGRKERFACFLSLIDNYIRNTILAHNVTELLIACDGSAKYRYPSTMTDLCISGGISMIPFFPGMKEKESIVFRSLPPVFPIPKNDSYLSLANHSLLFNVHPISNLASNPVDSELVAFISSLIIANFFQQRLKAISTEKNVTSLYCNLHFISDSRSLCRLFRLSNSTASSSVSSVEISSDNSSSTIYLIDLLKQQKFSLYQTINLTLSRGDKDRLVLKWIKGHPEKAVISSPSK